MTVVIADFSETSSLEQIPHWYAIPNPLTHGPKWATSPLPDGEGLGEGASEANQEFALDVVYLAACLAFSSSINTRRNTLPTWVLGSSLRKSITRGTL